MSASDAAYHSSMVRVECGVVLLATLLVGGGCSRATAPPPPPKVELRAADQRTITDKSRPTKRVDAVALTEAREIMKATYRIRPDRRFVNAAADVLEINGHGPISGVETDFDGGRWHVAVAGREAITLPELATFQSALAELTRWASQQQPAKTATVTPEVLAAVDSDLQRFYPRFAFSALRRLEGAAGGQTLTGTGLSRAAHAATLLAVQAVDEFGISDVLQQRALALLAVARADAPKCCEEEEVLLAHSFGYEAEATKAAQSRPTTSLARAFVGLAATPSGDAAAWIASRATRNVDETPREVPDLEATVVLLTQPDSEYRAASAPRVRKALVDAMRQHTTTGSGADFETLLPDVARRLATRFVDARSVRSFYEAAWYAAAYHAVDDTLRRMGQPDEVDALTRKLQPRSITGAQVVSWMSQMTAARYGRSQNPRLQDVAKSVALLGGNRRWDLLETVGESISNNARFRPAAAELFLSLDSRPSETLVAGNIADFPIGHIDIAQTYIRSALTRAPRTDGSAASMLFRIGATDALRKLATTRETAASDRLDALAYLGRSTEQGLNSEYERALAESGYDPEYLSGYAGYLNSRGQPQVKERFARLVLQKRPDLHPITKANVAATLADALERQQRYVEAWTVAEPHIQVFSENIVSTAVSLLQRLGREAEAIKLGQQMVERYPSADARADYARVLWRMRRHSEAAALFDADIRANSAETFQQYVPQAFVDTFSDTEIDEAAKAYTELISSRLPVALLARFPGEALARKRWALSYALEEKLIQLSTSGSERAQQLTTLPYGYAALRQLQGDDEAGRWFLKHSPPGNDLGVIITLFTERHFDLIRHVVRAHPPAAENRTLAASVIAAALALDRVPTSDARWKEMRQMLPAVAPPRGSGATEYTAALYLLGQADTSALNASVSNAHDRCSAAFFTAVGELSRGDHDNALMDLLVAADGPGGYPPSSWAITQLYIWRATNRSWEVIKRLRIV
jgi:tetratricopeptide (TPR) repeat protein